MASQESKNYHGLPLVYLGGAFKTKKEVFKNWQPGWFPGTERLGDLMMVPERQDRVKYDPEVPLWVKVYAVVHFLLVFLAFENLAQFNVVEMP